MAVTASAYGIVPSHYLATQATVPPHVIAAESVVPSHDTLQNKLAAIRPSGRTQPPSIWPPE
ncbi:Hypothetical predicted protein, partial [Prunus dulcis]